MGLGRKFVFALGFLAWASAPFAMAGEKSHPEKWREHMTALSKIVVDSFPFFYSSSEFKDPKNSKVILGHLNSLANALHDLPAESGESMIGAEPLIGNVQFELKGTLNEAIALYRKGDFESAQRRVHGAIQKCFACHTAHQIGPQFPATNGEVAGMPTPFFFGKAVVFGALRQFDGALDLIEKQGFSRIKKSTVTSDDLVKLYLVVSLRTKQDFPRALAFLKRLRVLSPDSEVLKKWETDVESWRDLAGKGTSEKITRFVESRKKVESGEGDALFVVYLLESSLLHKRFLSKDATKDYQQSTYRQLAKAYAGLHFSALDDLSSIYAKAADSLGVGP
jgi:tetratricopeptide (TPR) repeat protein